MITCACVRDDGTEERSREASASLPSLFDTRLDGALASITRDATSNYKMFGVCGGEYKKPMSATES